MTWARFAPSGKYNVASHANGIWTLIETVDDYRQAIERADAAAAAQPGLWVAVFNSSARRVHVGGWKEGEGNDRPIAATRLAGLSDPKTRGHYRRK